MDTHERDKMTSNPYLKENIELHRRIATLRAREGLALFTFFVGLLMLGIGVFLTI